MTDKITREERSAAFNAKAQELHDCILNTVDPRILEAIKLLLKPYDLVLDTSYNGLTIDQDGDDQLVVGLIHFSNKG